MLLASLVAGLLACPALEKEPLAKNDIMRHLKTIPGRDFVATGSAAIRRILNKHLQEGPLALPRVKSCEDFDISELNVLQREIQCLRDATLSYGAGDRRAAIHLDVESLQAEQDEQEAYILGLGGDLPIVNAALRDAKCHEIAMYWTHHLSHGSREHLAANTSLVFPLLPSEGEEEHKTRLLAVGHKKVAQKLAAAVTCQVGHEAKMEARVAWEGFPHWPSEVEYDASGYGPYPFWTGGGGSGGSLSGKGADIHTWWSAVQNAERLDHSTCNLAGLGGKSNAPCTHLFLNGSWAFLFDKEETFCCMSSAPDQYDKCHLTRPQRDFMDVFTYDGVIDYTSEDGLYTGQAKKYSMHLTNPPNFWFWYVTDMQDRPLEQGEGPCSMYDGKTKSRQCSGPPKMLFHQYHRDSFMTNVTIDPSVFNIPDICKKVGVD